MSQTSNKLLISNKGLRSESEENAAFMYEIPIGYGATEVTNQMWSQLYLRRPRCNLLPGMVAQNFPRAREAEAAGRSRLRLVWAT